MGSKPSKSKKDESELSSNLLFEGNLSSSSTRSSFSEQSDHTTITVNNTEQIPQDLDKIHYKSINIEYIERDVVKKVNGPGGQKDKPQKFEWTLYRKLLHYVWKEKMLNFLIYSTLIISTMSQTFIPYIIGQLLNEVTKTGEGTNVQSTSLIFLFLILVTCVFGFIRIAASNILGQKVMQDLKKDIFAQFLGNDLAFFEKHKTGELMSRLGRDVATAKSAVSFNTTMLLRNLMLCLSNVVMLFILSWKVSLAILPIIPSYYLVTKYYSFKSKAIEKKTSDISAASSELAEEVFSGIMTVKAFGQEEYEKKRYQQILNDEYKENKMSGFLNAGFFTVNNTLLSNLGILIVLWYGGYLVTTASEEGLSSGDLASFILYSTSLATNSSAISYGLGAIISAMGALDRIFEMLQYDSVIKFNTGKNVDVLTGKVQFQEVKFSYPSTKTVQVLHGIDFTISAGECVAFVGTSGSGKSTVVKLIERFYDSTSGSINFDSHNIKEISSASIRNHIALVSQEPILFSGTLLDNIVYGVNSYTLRDVDHVCDMAGVSEFLKDKSLFPIGYQTVVGERGTKLSGGQKQRVAIARALIKKPEILIFDEATSALDAESEYLVQTSIDSLIQNRTMTIIVIAHRLSTIKNCSRIFVMKQGMIVESGSHTELIAKEGIYKQLINKQLQEKM